MNRQQALLLLPRRIPIVSITRRKVHISPETTLIKFNRNELECVLCLLKSWDRRQRGPLHYRSSVAFSTRASPLRLVLLMLYSYSSRRTKRKISFTLRAKGTFRPRGYFNGYTVVISGRDSNFLSE